MENTTATEYKVEYTDLFGAKFHSPVKMSREDARWEVRDIKTRNTYRMFCTWKRCAIKDAVVVAA